MAPAWVRVTSRALLAIAALAVAYLSLVPAPPSGPLGNDKIAHVLAYLALGCLTAVAVPVGGTVSRLATTTGTVSAYGVAIEFLQRLTGREFELLDMAANLVGAALGAVVGAVALGILSRLNRSRPGPQ